MNEMRRTLIICIFDDSLLSVGWLFLQNGRAEEIYRARNCTQPLFSHCEWGLPRRADSPVGKTGRSELYGQSRKMRTPLNSVGSDGGSRGVWPPTVEEETGSF